MKVKRILLMGITVLVVLFAGCENILDGEMLSKEEYVQSTESKSTEVSHELSQETEAETEQETETETVQETEAETAQESEAETVQEIETETTQESETETSSGSYWEYYAYECLGEQEKIWYTDIYTILSGRLEEGDLDEELIGGLEGQDVDKIFRCVLNDHPELFYVSGYNLVTHTRNDVPVKLVFQGKYTMDAEEIAVRQEQIELAVSRCLQGISGDAGEYEKVKYVYEYVVKNTEYRLDAPQNQNICSVFIGQESVCQGYAKAVQYLLSRMNVFCTLVIGTVDDGMGHAWNLVRVDGEYYYVDSTWGDASYLTAGESSYAYPAVNYDYLCVTTEQLCRTHVIENVVPMPECTSMDANYYVLEGAYFEAYEEETIGAFLKQSQTEGLDTVTLKCANEHVYSEMYEELITNQNVFKYVEVADGILVYSDNRRQLSLTIWLAEE